MRGFVTLGCRPAEIRVKAFVVALIVLGVFRFRLAECRVRVFVVARAALGGGSV